MAPRICSGSDFADSMVRAKTSANSTSGCADAISGTDLRKVPEFIIRTIWSNSCPLSQSSKFSRPDKLDLPQPVPGQYHGCPTGRRVDVPPRCSFRVQAHDLDRTSWNLCARNLSASRLAHLHDTPEHPGPEPASS